MPKQKKIKLLFCMHDRGEGKRSCAASGANALRKQAKADIDGQCIKLKKSGCLSQCKHGPVIQMLPSKLYYHCPNDAALKLILRQAAMPKGTTDSDDADDTTQPAQALLIRTGKAGKK